MPRSRLLWRGTQGLPEVEAAIARGEEVEITLPHDTHHALFAHLYPAAAPSDADSIDAVGGAELLHAMAGVAGLAELELLREPVRRARYWVELTSPLPHLELFPASVARPLRLRAAGGA